MRYRRLGKTGLQVSEIGFGGEWLERHPEAEGIELIHHAAAQGINILDCWMADPTSRDIIGKGIRDNRSHWYIQGHIGSTALRQQYDISRDLPVVKRYFEDLLRIFGYIDFGMMFFIDSEADYEGVFETGFADYVLRLKQQGDIRHIGFSSHNPVTAAQVIKTGLPEMMMFSINLAFDLHPAGIDALERLLITGGEATLNQDWAARAAQGRFALVPRERAPVGREIPLQSGISCTFSGRIYMPELLALADFEKETKIYLLTKLDDDTLQARKTECVIKVWQFRKRDCRNAVGKIGGFYEV